MQRIGNYPFDLTYMVFDESSYENTLQKKHDQMRGRFQELFTVNGVAEDTFTNIDIIASPAMHSRQKCRFAIGFDGVGKSTASEVDQNLPLVHLMWESGHPTVIVDAFPIASRQIYNTMPILLSIIQSDVKFKPLKDGFAAVHYLSTLAEHLLITMIYELPYETASFEKNWQEAAVLLHKELLSRRIPNVGPISIIGRCKGVKIVVGDDFVFESLALNNGRILRYKQVEEGFSNPNSVVNQRALDWLCSIAQEITGIGKFGASAVDSSNNNGKTEQFDLLEMYCGNGNHTVALAPYFSRVMGVEINPNLCAAATENFALNCITNADVVVADSGKFATQILRTKQYRLYPKVEKSATTADHAHTHSGSRQPTQLRPPEDSSREALCELVSEAPQTAAADPSGDSVAAEPRPVQEVQEREGNGDENREELSGETTADSTEEINVAPAADASTGDSERPKVLTDAQKARAIRKANVINATLAARNAARKAEPLYVFKFGTVLVDPPRCGLDTLTLSLVANYAHILYISCCPDSLMRDLAQLLKTHTLSRVAIFDQFAYTPHIETGVWLRAKK